MGLEEHLISESRVIATRRSIIGADPDLNSVHMAANAHFEGAINARLAEFGYDRFTGNVTTAIALACVRESFMSWTPQAGIDEFVRLLRASFALAAEGTAKSG